MSWFDTAKQAISQIEQKRKNKNKESTLKGDQIVSSIHNELNEKHEIRSIHLEEAALLFLERGWVQVFSGYLKANIYLVRDKWAKVPDPSIPKYQLEELHEIKELSWDERKTLHEAKIIFGGTIGNER